MRKRSAPVRGRPAASAETDSESGEAGGEGGGTRQALYALKVMRDRGMMSEDEYRRRRAKIEAGEG